jgi:hypothetical protein
MIRFSVSGETIRPREPHKEHYKRANHVCHMDLGEISRPIGSIRSKAIMDSGAYLVWNPMQRSRFRCDLMQRVDQLEGKLIERSISLSIDGGRN